MTAPTMTWSEPAVRSLKWPWVSAAPRSALLEAAGRVDATQQDRHHLGLAHRERLHLRVAGDVGDARDRAEAARRLLPLGGAELAARGVP